jgi:hypothetical protein
LAAVVIGGLALFIGRHEKQLQSKSAQEFPGELPRRCNAEEFYIGSSAPCFAARANA